MPTVPPFRLVALTPDGRDGEIAALSPGRTIWGRGAFPVWAATDAHLSPKHAAFSLSATGFFVEDLGSVNGVYIRLRAEAELRPGDVFRVGQQVLRFETVDQAEVVHPAAHGEGVPVFGSPLRGAWGRVVQVVAPAERAAAATLLSGTECIIGRERGTITFPYDGFVSSTHAVITNHGARVTLSDRGSSNGTFWRIREPASLRGGDILLLGQRLLRVDSARGS